MTAELSGEGPEKEIFLRALRAYSDACEPPSLTPDCPFAEDVGPDRRGCGEECLDILGEHGAPSSVEEVSLGGGLVVQRRRRPRSRRGPDDNVKPFDAAEVHHEDRVNEDLSLWRTAALLGELRDLVRVVVPEDGHDEHRDRLNAVVTEVGARGLPVDDFLTDYLARDAAMALTISLAIAEMASDRTDLPELAVPEALRQFAKEVVPQATLDARAEPVNDGEDGDGDGDGDGEVLNDILHRHMSSPLPNVLATWMRSIGADAVLGRVQPDNIDDLLGLMPAPWASLVQPTDASWLMNRFTVTYLSDWMLDSLRREWKYGHGEHPGPATARVMSERTIDTDAVARELADRACDEADQTGEVSPSAHFVELAVTYLRDGQRELAASMFRHLSASDPTDPEPINNAGFCVLPDEPEEALALLRSAAEKGFRPLAINAANRAIALALLGRADEAAQLARRAAELSDTVAPTGAVYMWGLDMLGGGPPRLVVTSFRDYVRDLTEALAASPHSDLSG